jgi:hypothetical protein
VGQTSLLFVAVVLEAGLLFAPEVTLIAAGISTTFTAFAILLSLSLAPSLDKHEAYLLVIYTLGLQALAGLIAWLLAQFIFESAIEAQRGQEMQFAQARLEALTAQIADQQDQLDEQIGIIQATITRALAGEYHVRAEVPQGELAPIAESLSLLLERVQAVTQAEQMQSRMQAAALPLIDAISRMGDASTPTPSSLPIITNTPFDSVSAVVSQMQASVGHRLARVQQLVGEIVSVLDHSRDGLDGASEAVQEAQRITGALLATTEGMLAATHRQIGLILHIRRMLTAVLPEEITRQATADDARRKAALAQPSSSLLGLGRDLGLGTPGNTAEFDIVKHEEGEDSGIAPLTVPLPAVDLAGGDANPADADSQAAREPSAPAAQTPAAGQGITPELIEVWNLAQQLDAEAAHSERVVSQLARELGVQTRHMRSADASIAWFRQALEAVRGNAEQLQQLAGPNLPPPASPSRPLAPEERLSQPVSPPMGVPIPRETPPPAQPLTQPPTQSAPPDGGTLAELASLAAAFPPPEEESAGPATGSLRAADLLMMDDDPLEFPFDEA